MKPLVELAQAFAGIILAAGLVLVIAGDQIADIIAAFRKK